MANLPATKQETSLKSLLNQSNYKNRFVELLGNKAVPFMSAVINIYNSNDLLQKCSPNSIISAAALVATLDLSISPAFGQAYIVPYKDKDGSYKATFQIGAKGLVQLAHRTGQYVALHAGAVKKGELRGFNPITGEPQIGEKISDETVGYVAYMKLVNGFEKTLYMTKTEIERHAEKFSQSYQTDKKKGWNSSPWSKNFDAMATKTVLKKLLSNWGVLSDFIATAIQGDQAVVDKDSFTYVDNGSSVSQRDSLLLPSDDSFADSSLLPVEEVAVGSISAPF